MHSTAVFCFWKNRRNDCFGGKKTFNVNTEHLWYYFGHIFIFLIIAMVLEFNKNLYCFVWAHFKFLHLAGFCSVFIRRPAYRGLFLSGYLASFVQQTWQPLGQGGRQKRDHTLLAFSFTLKKVFCATLAHEWFTDQSTVITVETENTLKG